ncbi:hypothetical protein LWE61_19540 [Sphingobium sufflavum]|uniref:hypothetical protein n=1 Tax=Sphingobium sufflavum TaxID=1129547 RepID=UPI001F47C782|nr:hypothetical protein [Sphingobium sufflavum]MCE7798726.1 hypothetical protein [Sphingobium sufflavum]
MTNATPKDDAARDNSREDVARNDGVRGPLGDARPDAETNDPTTGAAEKPEEVEDRPNVSIVKPDDYPAKDREDSSPIGG